MTLIVAAFPTVPIAVEQQTLRVVLDTVVALVALLLAYLVYGRFLVRRRSTDLLLAATLCLAGVMNAVLAVAPQLGPLGPDGLTLLVWGPLIGRLLVAAGFAASAWLSRDSTSHLRRPGRLLLLGCLALTLVVTGAVTAVAELLPAGAVPDLEARGPVLRTDGAEAVVTALRLLSGLLYVVAAAGFMRRSDDPLAAALTASTVLLAFSRVNYALVPSLYPHWVHAGDLLRLAAYGVLLVAAAGEIRRYWADQAHMAVQEERRRLARALHDGLAQEVNLVATQTRLWADGRTAMEPRLLAGAAERALDESRAAIHALTGDLDEPLDVALMRVADDLEGRLGIRIVTDVQPVPVASGAVREAFVRAAREAVVNAARHGCAGRVTVALREREREGVRMTVTDDGHGFDTAAARDGFGLAAVRGRLTSVGAQLQIRSQPGDGATVEVELS